MWGIVPFLSVLGFYQNLLADESGDSTLSFYKTRPQESRTRKIQVNNTMKINRLLPLLALAAALPTVACGKLEDRINSLEQRIAELEDTKIPSIDAQVTSINRTIGDMEKTDAALKEYISALQEKSTALEAEIGKTNKSLEDAQAALRSEMASDKAEMSGEISSAKADVIAQLEAFKTLMEGELGTLNTTISELKAKDEELQQKMEELRAYVDTENGKLRDWADATFSTIEQQNSLAETVAGIKAQFESLNTYTQTLDVRLTNRTEELSKSLSSLDESTKQQIDALTEKMNSDISALRTELTDAYTKLVATEITKLETSMKSWVNDKLAGYYTVEQTDAKLEAMKSELGGRIDSEKAYLVTLITNLETSTNKKIAANSSLITGMRGDLSSLQQSVAENAGQIADDAILIGQNAAAVSKNGAAIAANTKDIATVKSLAAENKGLIAENSAKISEMQALLKTLKDSGIDDYAATIVKNTEDIAANASLIVKNSEDIRSNAAAIAKNAEDIAALQTKLGSTKTELVEAYTAAIAKAISDYDGTITSKLATDISKVEEKVQACRDDITALTSKIAALEDKVTALEGVISQIASISYIPRYADGAERVEYTRDALDIIPGAVILRFDVHPASAAAEIAANWESLLSARAVYTLTKAGAGDFIDLSVTGATAENGVLSVTVATDAMNKDFILGNLSASAVIKITSESKNIVSDYVKLTPTSDEIKFVKYLVANFDTDGDGVLNTEAVEAVKELKVSGMNISTLEGVLERMPNLEVLDCSNNNLRSLNLSNNVNIEELNVSCNHLTTLGGFLENMEQLGKLDCSKNSIESLIVRGNVNMQMLDCCDNAVKTIDLSQNINLLELYVANNQLKKLDVRNTRLYAIDFSGNDSSMTVDQNGVYVAGKWWSLYDIGSCSTLCKGNLLKWSDAKAQCPYGWRLPTKEEFDALALNYSDPMRLRGNYGRWFYGEYRHPDQNKGVFLPFMKETRDSGYIGEYWSSSVSTPTSYYKTLSFNEDIVRSVSSCYMEHGRTVRCVKD